MSGVLVITNACAGSADSPTVDQAVALLREHREVRVIETEDPNDLADKLADRAQRNDPETELVIIGGDGSLHVVVATLYERGELPEVTLGLIPLGTGNDYARTLRLPTDPAEAVRRYLDSTPRRVDLLVSDDGCVCINAVHIGVGAEAARSAQPWKEKLGWLGYPVGALIAALTDAGTVKLEILIDGKALSRHSHVLQVALGNGTYVGAGTPLLPDADPGSGQMDVAVTYVVHPLRRVAYAGALKLGRHLELSHVVVNKAKEVTLRGQSFSSSCDGELLPETRSSTWRVQPGAVNLRY